MAGSAVKFAMKSAKDYALAHLISESEMQA